MNVNILNIQRFCTKDGPGIRTTVFFKGCPLSCLWCHNPESQATRRELMYQAEKCVHCLRCTRLCPSGCHTQADGKHQLDRTACTACGNCLSPFCEALEIAGKRITTDEILQEVLKDALYYRNSGGGMTLSGGEPLVQWEAALELLRAAKEHGIHTCVETCGAVSREIFEKILPWTDLYLFDCKETDPVRHKAYTGVDNRQILDNLFYLDAQKKPTVLRCPIIPHHNDRDDHLDAIAEIANKLSYLTEIAIEPYHTLGVGKYERLGRSYAIPDEAPLETAVAEHAVKRLRDLVRVPVKKA